MAPGPKRPLIRKIIRFEDRPVLTDAREYGRGRLLVRVRRRPQSLCRGTGTFPASDLCPERLRRQRTPSPPSGVSANRTAPAAQRRRQGATDAGFKPPQATSVQPPRVFYRKHPQKEIPGP